MAERRKRPQLRIDLPISGRGGSDRIALGWALTGAICVHILVFLLPLPATSPVVILPPPADDPPYLTPTPLPPPPRRDLPATDPPRTSAPRLPVPFTATPPAEPLTEPPRDLDAFCALLDVPLMTSTPVPPPRPAGPRIPGFDGVTHPALIPGSKVAPVYPELARRAGVGTRVVLRAVILGDGTVGEIEVLRCDRPNLGFEQAAIEAIARWRYEPARLRGRPVDVYFTVVVDFDLR